MPSSNSVTEHEVLMPVSLAIPDFLCLVPSPVCSLLIFEVKNNAFICAIYYTNVPKHIPYSNYH